MYRSNRSFHIPPPGHTPGTPWAFDTFAVPGRREFDYQSLPGGGEFDPHALGVGNLNCTLDFMWGRGVRGFSWKRLCLCGQLVTRKGLKQALCRIWRYLNFNIFNIGFRLWIYECIKLCLQWNTIPFSGDSSNNSCISIGEIFFIERFVCCMTHEENLSIQWPCSSDFRRFAREFCS